MKIRSILLNLAVALIALIVLFPLVWMASVSFMPTGEAATFQLLHAAIHVGDGACGSSPLSDFVRDFPGVFLPALLTAWIVWRARPKPTGA